MRLDGALPVTSWARRYAAPEQPPSLRLLCFSYAGAGASTYRDWRLPDRLAAEVWAVQLPGRENRRREQPFRRLDPLVAELSRQLRPLMDLPFAFFGHSMGALIAFELTRHLRRTGAPLPTRLFLSACRAPDLPSKRGPVSMLPDDQFLARLDQMAGESPSAIRDSGLLLALAPTIRADFEICENYVYRAESPLPLPFTCFAADDDYEVDPPDVRAWARHATESCRTVLFPGGHLFLRDQAAEMLGHLAADMIAHRA